MQIKSLSDIPDALFWPLKQWVEQSNLNLNILVGFSLILIVLITLGWSIMTRKIGKVQDERTAKIYLTASSIMLSANLACDIIFPTDYLMNQFRMIKYIIMFLAGLIYLFTKYRKEIR
ncbi:MAG: DUF2178 domain-containing protein [Furfurilactobacillus sp.]|jgi:hypothetical protein|uniref:DUF2178 domain-containing protein n=1 Tax=Furfurilactobacillus TaxID=2767882 RepID=UPI001F1F71DA|nr:MULTISPECIES: DUF2178 domain-containing protein [Furfurilactobacillus]MCF6419733.1 DUF2178 domain-containing protein [Furfurilactobacillus milii]MCH4012637.1 DUF2178 domain-containing protein [Furfurilactobacillus sp.]MCH4036220.1 DUF2178 domain-containing protein [Furfurilactobacillus sp.]MCH4114834.1 DUF2178 domain-containing protein [Furfurilactobacillus sp.]MCH4133589.1 DUF2178 domain-containing protein [Furfurilactobacillus sp.]